MRKINTEVSKSNIIDFEELKNRISAAKTTRDMLEAQKKYIEKLESYISEPKPRKGRNGYTCYVKKSVTGTEKKVFAALTAEEAKAKAVEWLESVFSGEKEAEKISTVGELIEHYLDNVYSVKNTANTYAQRKAQYNKHIKNADISRKRLDKLKKSDCDMFVYSLYEKNLSAGSVVQIKGIVNSALDYAEGDELIKTNYMRHVEVNRNKCSIENIREKGAFSNEEILNINESILKDMKSPKGKTYDRFKYIPAIMVMIYTGIRVGEMIALDWSDIDEKNKVIRIKKTAVYVKNRKTGKYETIIKTPKTTDSIREVVLSDYALYWLNIIKERNKNRGINSDIVLCNRKGERARYASIRQSYIEFCDKYNLDYKTIHTCRRSFATILLDNGANLKDVSANLGHKKVSMTQDVYYKSRTTTGERREAFDDIFKNVVGN